MRKPTVSDLIFSLFQQRLENGQEEITPKEITENLEGSRATINRHLDRLLENKQLIRTGQGRSTRYRLQKEQKTDKNQLENFEEPRRKFASPDWSSSAKELLDIFDQPLGVRTPVTYNREFVDVYVPNSTSLLSPSLASALYQEGRMQGQQPAGTYARKVLEQLLIDLSYQSSKLEGNRYTLLATEELFKAGRPVNGMVDSDAIMLLNHKEAIEFLVDAVPTYGLTVPVVSNVHSILMNGLLADSDELGSIRKKVVNISDTVYTPLQVPNVLAEMLSSVIEKARHIKNPVEAAFFLWVNLAYLQPFEDGNKRTSRLSANIPLLLYNCAPLSFMDVGPTDYAKAMLGVYELRNAKIAEELFAWTYRRSIQRYAVVLESLDAPDAFRAKYRAHLSDAIQQVVLEQSALEKAVSIVQIPEEDRNRFIEMLRSELKILDIHNCGRYRLQISRVENWVKNGRPIYE